eukprot:6387392-Pyramimonas_sp.AAC.1
MLSVNSGSRAAAWLVITGDIRRVRFSNPELRTLSAAQTRSAKLLLLGAAGLVLTGIDSETSDASVCRMQRSELCLILELGLPNYSYCSSHLERCDYARNSGCRGATEL